MSVFSPNIFRSDITACSRRETCRVSPVNLKERTLSLAANFCQGQGLRGGRVFVRSQNSWTVPEVLHCFKANNNSVCV